MPHSPGIGAIFGIVSENGIAKAGGRVGLYDRSSMLLVQKTVADTLGGYVFTGLNQTTNDYLVMALDDDGSPAKNALVQDYVQPIPGHMGAVAYSNWEQRARRKDPGLLWVPRYQGTFPETMGASNSARNLGTTSGTYVLQGSVTPGAPQFPTIRLNSGYVFSPPLSNAFFWPKVGSDALTFECTFDTTYDSQVTLRGYGITSGNSREICEAGLSWVASTKTMRIASANGQFTHTYVLSDNTYFLNGTYVATGLSNGIHHFALVVVLAVTQKLYIDGNLVLTRSIAGSNALLNTAHPDCIDIGCIFSNINNSGVNIIQGSGIFGPMAAYHSALSDAEVLASYNDLMIGTVPASTGYVREILTDDPGLLYRLDDPTYGSATEFLTGNTVGKHYGTTITFTNPSPVVGGAMTYFNGGVMKSVRGGGGGSPSQRSYEFWVKPDTATPPATTTILCSHYTLDNDQFWYKVQQIQTTGVLRLQVLTGASSPGYTNEQMTFLYAPPAGVTTHIVIVLDKLVPICKLYVNGVFQEQVSATASFLSDGASFGTTQAATDCYFVIGGWITSVAAISETFKGMLGDVALYYKALPVDRIKAHYDARLLI